MTPLEHLRAQIQKKLDERGATQKAIDDLLEAVQERGADAKLTDDEQKLFDAYRATNKTNDEERASLEATEKDMLENERAREAAEEAQRRYGANGGQNGGKQGAYNANGQRKAHQLFAVFIVYGNLSHIAFIDQLFDLFYQVFAVQGKPFFICGGGHMVIILGVT